jgi:hypothetical protein
MLALKISAWVLLMLVLWGCQGNRLQGSIAHDPMVVASML